MSKQIILKGVVLLLILLLLSSCGKKQTTNEDNKTNAENVEKENEEESEINYEESIAYVEEKTGISIKEYITDATGLVQKSKWYFIKLSINEDKKDDLVKALVDSFGEGIDPSSISMPAFKNAICDELRSMTVEKVYLKNDYDNDLKSKSETMMFLAKDSEGLYYLFVL